jgi:hypothetical protein
MPTARFWLDEAHPAATSTTALITARAVIASLWIPRTPEGLGPEMAPYIVRVSGKVKRFFVREQEKVTQEMISRQECDFVRMPAVQQRHAVITDHFSQAFTTR